MTSDNNIHTRKLEHGGTLTYELDLNDPAGPIQYASGELRSVSKDATIITAKDLTDINRIPKGIFNGISGAPIKKIELIGFKAVDAFAFDGNVTLEEVVMDGYVDCQPNAFRGCQRLQKVTMLGVITTLGFLRGPQLYNSMFAECYELKAVEFVVPDTKFLRYEPISKQGAKAFKGCISLESASLPAMADKLPDEIFSGCTNLKTVKLIATSAVMYFEIPESSIEECHKDLTIYLGACHDIEQVWSPVRTLIYPITGTFREPDESLFCRKSLTGDIPRGDDTNKAIQVIGCADEEGILSITVAQAVKENLI